MKYLLTILMLCGLAYGQSKVYIRADTVQIYKDPIATASAELKLVNSTKDTLGPLVNLGKGITRFVSYRALKDSLAVTGENFANTNLTWTGYRIHNQAGYNTQIYNGVFKINTNNSTTYGSGTAGGWFELGSTTSYVANVADVNNSAWLKVFRGVGASYAQLSGINAGNQTLISSEGSRILLSKATAAALQIDGLTYNGNTNFKVLVQDTTTGYVYRQTITGGSGTNLATANQTATGNRVHNWAGYNFSLDSVGYYYITKKSNAFGTGYFSMGDDETEINNSSPGGTSYGKLNVSTSSITNQLVYPGGQNSWELSPTFLLLNPDDSLIFTPTAIQYSAKSRLVPLALDTVSGKVFRSNLWGRFGHSGEDVTVTANRAVAFGGYNMIQDSVTTYRITGKSDVSLGRGEFLMYPVATSLIHTSYDQTKVNQIFATQNDTRFQVAKSGSSTKSMILNVDSLLITPGVIPYSANPRLVGLAIDTVYGKIYRKTFSGTGNDSAYVNILKLNDSTLIFVRDNDVRDTVIFSSGGAGGSGTVNSGTANRLAYYPSTGTTVDDLAAITANRALISDANGLPVHATTTATEIGYVNGVTSAIQTQLDAKQPLDADLTTIAGLTATTDNFLVSVSSAWASRTPAQVKTTLALNNVDNTSDATKNSASVTLTNKSIDADNNTLTHLPAEIGLAISDETTALTTGTAKITFRMPYAMTVTAVRFSVNTVSSSGTPTVDINEGGTTILSTKLSIDASEKTSTTAATAAVISDATLADDAEITIDIDVAGTGAKGGKVWIIGKRN